MEAFLGNVKFVCETKEKAGKPLDAFIRIKLRSEKFYEIIYLNIQGDAA